MSHVEIPVRLDAWLSVEDGNVTGIDLCLDTIELDHDSNGRTAFECGFDDGEAVDLTADKAGAIFDDLPRRHLWDVTRVESSDGTVYLDAS